MIESDLELLRRYSHGRSEDAFTEIVRRYVDLVYSAALRQAHSPQLAEEIAQSAFTDLARQAPHLAPNTILTAWLCEVTRRTAIDVVRGEARRQIREQTATELNTMKATEADWTQIGPLLDEAVSTLDAAERAAVLLRYFENRSLREVGQQLGISDDAAQKRVSRAVEHLREFCAKCGLAVSASGLVALISANAVHAAPSALLASANIVGATTFISNKAILMTALHKTLVTAEPGAHSSTVPHLLRAEVLSNSCLGCSDLVWYFRRGGSAHKILGDSDL